MNSSSSRSSSVRKNNNDSNDDEGINVTTTYTPEDVYKLTRDGNAAELIVALNQGDNSTKWYEDERDRKAIIMLL